MQCLMLISRGHQSRALITQPDAEPEMHHISQEYLALKTELFLVYIQYCLALKYAIAFCNTSNATESGGKPHLNGYEPRAKQIQRQMNQNNK